MKKLGVVTVFNRLLICFLILAFYAGPIFANFETYGARPMGMGGAFTAVADDANAAYWNPAGLALNPEVAFTASTKINNRNLWVGDNIGNIKLCYETEMNPFLWIAGIGAVSLMALQGARYLSSEGILKKGWGREGEKTERGESMAEQVKGSEEVVSLRQEAKEALKTAGKGVLKEGEQVEQAAISTGKEIVKESVKESIRPYYFAPFSPLWYTPDYYHPHYWEPAKEEHSTKAQFALGLSWLNDYNALPAFDQNTNWYTLSLASGFEQRVAIGTNLNFYNLQKISTGIKGIGGDLDIGIIAKPVEYISLGIMAKGVLTTDIQWQDSSSSRYEMLVNGGVAIKPLPALTVAADMHNLLQQNGKTSTMHYGVEATVLPALLVRAGLYDGNKTAGASLALGNLVIDYTMLGGAFNRTQMAGASWRF